MNSYNSYTPQQRMAAFNWLKGEYASGRRAPAKECEVCHQTQNTCHHSENYAPPYGAHIGEFELCFSCHMAIHNRFKHPEAWDTYRAFMRRGGQFPAMGRNYPRFMALFTGRSKEGPVIFPGHVRETTALDTIDGWLLAHTGKGWR